jgi:sugar O-acyltransferase (sialic acid O-acetyltransferase NeuD family)
MSIYAIIGAGGMGQEVRETLIALFGPDIDCQAFVDDEFIGEHSTFTKVSSIHELFDEPDAKVFIALGNGAQRAEKFELLKETVSFPTLIHPTAIVGSNCTLGDGSIIQPFAILTTNILIGQFAQINIQTSISHDCVIGDYFTSAPKATIAGHAKIGNHVTMGTACVVLPGIRICDHVIIGAGAVVTKDIKESGTYVGIPARRVTPE